MGRNQREKVNQKRKKRRIFPSLFCARARWRTANTRRQCDFTFSFSTRKQLCCDFAGGQSDPTPQKLSKQTLKFSPAFFKRQRLWSPCAQGEILFYKKAQEGRRNSPVDCFAVGNPRRGFPGAAGHTEFEQEVCACFTYFARHRLCKCFADRDKPCPYERFVIHLAQNNTPLSAR